MKQNLHGLAEKFMKDQIAIMKKHGADPQVNSERFAQAVKGTQRAFRGMSRVVASTRRTKV